MVGGKGPNNQQDGASNGVGGRPSAASNVMETVRTVIYAVLIAVLVRTFAFEPFNIPSGSMVPTLLVGDYLFVSKYSYGYSRHSFPFSLAPIDGRIMDAAPERGDVAVFKLPSDGHTDYVKRIIGLPGDRIQMQAGVLHINGEPVIRRRIEDYVADDPRGGTIRAPQYVEILPNGRSHHIIETAGDFGPLDDTREYVVPVGHYFAMGDNRDNSSDSRVLNSVGYIPAANLVGRAEFLFFSTDGSASIWEVWKWPFAVRYARLFSGIE